MDLPCHYWRKSSVKDGGVIIQRTSRRLELVDWSFERYRLLQEWQMITGLQHVSIQLRILLLRSRLFRLLEYSRNLRQQIPLGLFYGCLDN